jgi:hypothetical protein
MTDLLGHAARQTRIILAILAHMLVCGRQLEALWVLSEPNPGMIDLLGHAVDDSFWAILAHVGVWQAAGGTLVAFRASGPGMTDLLGHAAEET